MIYVVFQNDYALKAFRKEQDAYDYKNALQVKWEEDPNASYSLLVYSGYRVEELEYVE